MNTEPSCRIYSGRRDFLERYYSVTWQGKICGKASVKRQGLYTQINCNCILDHNDIYRLILYCDDIRKNLGILVPTQDNFGIVTKIPAKQLPEGEWAFRIQSKHQSRTSCFIPICPEEPFAYISRLKDSFLLSQNGQLGIRSEKMQE